MYLSIIFLPLLGSIVSGFFGRKTGVNGSHIVSTSCVIITTIWAILAFFEIGFNNNTVSISLFEWLISESFNIKWDFKFDSLTVSMLIPVLVISSLVHIYSIEYMSSDPHNQRFFSYLNLFTFMMILLVTGNNYLLMFVGWEGVGVCSYLLVSFWFTRIAANQSSISAFLTNRVGDCFLIIGMFGLLWTLGNLDYSTIFSLAPYINTDVITIIGICLLMGAMAKSAQLGLHIWLPMAMEGPTPVSALIHAATMVTAGVYLLIRSSPLIEYSSTLLLICLWLGAITTLSSSMIGLFQGDIKKIIAYSTMSQLGMMFVAIGSSSYAVALFHLINHAFYKGLLFLGAGSVIHAVSDNQDLRKYGGLIHSLPLTYSVMFIASLSLVAIPFMTGFYSKDLILESSYSQHDFPSIAVYFISVTGAVFTTLYSVKIAYLTFIANPNGSLNYSKNAHEGKFFMSLPLVILAIFSMYFGFLTKEIYVGLGSGFFNNNSIFIHPMHEILTSAEFGIDVLIKFFPFFLTGVSIGFATVVFDFYPHMTNNFKLSTLGYNIFGFFNQRLLIEFFVNKYIVILTFTLGSQTTRVLDRGSVEQTGPYGGEKLLTLVGKSINALSTGMVTNYGLYIIIGIIVYIFGSNFYLFNIYNFILLYFIIISIHAYVSEISKDSTEISFKSAITLNSSLSSGSWNQFFWSFFLLIILLVISYFFPGFYIEYIGLAIAFIGELPNIAAYVINALSSSGSGAGAGMVMVDSSDTLPSKSASDKPTKNYLSMESPDDDSTGDADVEDYEMTSDDQQSTGDPNTAGRDHPMTGGSNTDREDHPMTGDANADPQDHPRANDELAQGSAGDADVEDYNVASDVKKYCEENPQAVKNMLQDTYIAAKDSNLERVVEHATKEQVRLEENLLERELDQGLTPDQAQANVDARLSRDRAYDKEYAAEKTEEFIEAMDYAKGTAGGVRNAQNNGSSYVEDVDMWSNYSSGSDNSNGSPDGNGNPSNTNPNSSNWDNSNSNNRGW
jgi:NADH-ubiquinone oxidoreductase chain 5